MKCLSFAKSCSISVESAALHEVGAVGRQEKEMAAGPPDGAAGGLAFVTAEVVEDDDVARRERRGENLLDVEGEELAVDRAVDDHHRQRR